MVESSPDDSSKGEDIPLFDVSYVMQGNELVPSSRPRHLAPWNKAQQAGEARKRRGEALNFYDEMLEVRSDAKRIYDEIMDSGELKYYSTAVSAVRERRGVVETLCKMSLIARQLSDGDGKVRKLSPALQGIVDTLIREDDEGGVQ